MTWPTAPNGKPARRVKIERGIYRSVSGKLEVCFTASDGRVRFEPQESPNITAARARRRELLAAKDRGATIRPQPTLKFGEVRTRWLAAQEVAANTITTRAYYASLLPWGECRMDRIDTDEVERVLRMLRDRGTAPSTVAKVRDVTRSIFRFAIERMKWAGSDPVPTGRMARASARPMIHADGALDATLAAATEPWRTLLHFIAHTGLRESEALGVRWCDLELSDDDPRVEVTGQIDRQGQRIDVKTPHSAAAVPLTRSVVLSLKAHRLAARCSSDEDYVFCSGTSRPLSQRNLLRALDAAQRRAVDEHGRKVYVTKDADGRKLSRKAAGLPHVHALRHTLATRLIEDGHRTEDATAILRHKDSEVTRRVYVHAIASVENRAKRRDLLEAMSRPAGSARPARAAEVVELREAGR